MKLPEIKIEINGIEYNHSFSADVQIDRTDLDEEFATQAQKYAYYGLMAEEAKFQSARRKTELDNIAAHLDHRKRQNANLARMKDPKFKFTETMCANEVKTDPEYREALHAYQEADKLAGQLDIAKRAIAMRRDMLIQMGASARLGVSPPRTNS